MKMSRRTQKFIRLQQGIFYILLIAVFTVLSKIAIDTNQRYDWTANAKHSLSAGTVTLLTELDHDIELHVFVDPDSTLRSGISDVLARYTYHTNRLDIHYIDPSFAPDLVRDFAIQQQGEIVVQRGELTQHVYDLSEQSITNALLAVSRVQSQWVVFIEGHDERSLFEQSDFGLSTWAAQLRSQGFKLHAHNLATNPTLPENTRLVVIASPLSDWLPGEVHIIQDYLQQGGQLLWLADPEQSDSLRPLAESLGLTFIDGTDLDPKAAQIGLPDPRYTLVSDYANHSIGLAVTYVSLFEAASALASTENTQDWTQVNLLNSQEEAWIESNPLHAGNLALQTQDEFDLSGPVSLGYALERKDESEERIQRAVVIGDSDFVTNSYLGTLANLDLAMGIMNWLVEDDELIAIPTKTSFDTQLLLTPNQALLMGIGFLFVLPILLSAIGFFIWWRRRRR
jgi:ABC-type uncharacterized transport system involved in gliding motility auxiliary subunit